MDLHVFAIDSPYNKTFVEFINRNFSDIPHTFVVMHPQAALRYPLPEQDNIIYLPVKHKSQYQPYYDLFNKADRIFAHSLFEPAFSLYAAYPGKKQIMYIPWGGDMTPFVFRNTADGLDAPTRRMFVGNKLSMISSALASFKNMRRGWRKRRKMNLIVQKTSHLLHITRFNHSVIQRAFGKELAALPFQYYNPVDFSLLESEDLPANPAYHFKSRFNKVIQLNHSSSPANNHISLINKLSELDRDDFCVVVPLSYGNPNAAKVISSYGQQKLGNRFFPIHEYLPPDQYAALLRQVDTMLINTFHSGGTANMILMLYRGGKVMVNHQNISTRAVFKSYGIELPTMNTDEGGSEEWLKEVFEPLDAATVAANRERIQASVSEQRLVDMYAHVLEKTA